MSLTSRLETRSGRPPAELTGFIGRREELAEVGRLFGRGRLVTLMGPGGVGKTRLAIRAAAALGGACDDGVCFADLSSLHEPGLLAQAVAGAFGLPDQSPAALDALVRYLADRRLLLVLDTCEHLVDGCAMLAEVLLQNAPGLRILATSRQPFDIPGEHTLVVAPLERPEPGRHDPLRPCASMRLFAERAAAVVPGWSLTVGNQSAVALLCHRLDGIPLAIELAAVQLRALSVEQIVDRLDHRILQVRGRRSSLPRHQTLRAAIDWSHDLCSPGERLLWARLSVFAGDFDLELAERICADAELPAAEVFELVAGLVAKSVVVRVESAETVRYRMLGTLREYGAERLDLRGETEALRARAFERFVGVIREAAAELAGPAQARWLEWFRREQATVRDMIDYGIRSAGPGGEVLRVALTLGRIFALQGLIGEARHWSARAVESHREEPGRDWTEALALAGLLAAMQNDLEAAGELVLRAEERALEAGDPGGLAYVREAQGVCALYAGDLDGATRLLTDSHDLHARAGTVDVLVPITDVYLGVARTLAGDVGAAVRHAAVAIRATEASGELWCRSYGLCVRGLAVLLGGDAENALPDLRAGMRIKRDIDDRLGIALALDMTGCCLIALGDAVGGVRLLGASDWTRDYTGTSMFGPQHALLRVVYEQKSRDLLGDEAYQAAYDSGRALDLATAVAEALGERPLPAALAEPAGRGVPGVPGRAGAAAVAAASGGAGTAAQRLTRREFEIAGLVSDGLTNREIAERLVIAKRTADSHVEHILAKLGFSSRTQIAAWFAQRSSPGAP
ncbi:LuxR C-terminal-related transcriptional regulator [Actinomadura xylanilytica]|uniref:LuxR C-terminal-related transcriptional regulator n=1 Tax=Actinomadura xylanilytica TaxID=887459 RepID=UPI00255A744B|nr:LuxR C-terminal-related transcriptional regulator [Actinomadura xylanilytica]MDL4774333.1 LuxR C-terminal-related transcriptional regulator [Actinomadura xylanilytica]